MGNYTTLRVGSSGDEVRKLQKRLIDEGYGDYLGDKQNDGIYGSKTEDAVKAYQRDNNLTIDGIAGDLTQGKIYSATQAPASTQAGTSGFQYTAYQDSDAVKQAEALLQQQLAQKPGAYQSTWQSQLNDTIQQILNRDKFSYDMNGDAMYQQLKDQYVNQGNLAMMDTMGQAQAMTGGYGNSYAQAVGQQAYQGYLQQLTDVVPELYGMALDQYTQEGQNLYNQAGLMAQMEDQEYGRYLDGLNAWLTERDYITGRYDSERDYDYGKYRDMVADRQWQTEFDEAKRQFDKQYALSASKYSSSTGGPSATRVSKSVANAAKTAAAVIGSLLPGGKPEPESKPTMQSISKNLDAFVAGGADKSEISSYIRSALAAGYITESQAQSLLKTYTPRGYTY